MKQPKHPCINCIYFKACGETTRTMPCEGRMTKSEKKKEVTNERIHNNSYGSNKS
jgi:hypothetical protein